MAVSSNLTDFGDLTGSGTQDLIYTAAGTAYVTVSFFNHSGSTCTLSMWTNTVADANLKLDAAEMLTKEIIVVEVKLGSGDKIYAEASAATSISAAVEEDTLS